MRPCEPWLGAGLRHGGRGAKRQAWADMLSDSETESYGELGEPAANYVPASSSSAAPGRATPSSPAPGSENGDDTPSADAGEVEAWAQELSLLAQQLQEVARRAPLSLRQTRAASKRLQRRQDGDLCDRVEAATQLRVQNLRAEATTLRNDLELAAEEAEAEEARHAKMREDLAKVSEVAAAARAVAADAIACDSSLCAGGLGHQARLRPCCLRLRLYEEQLDRLRPAEAALAERATSEQAAAADSERAARARAAAAEAELDGLGRLLKTTIASAETAEQGNRQLAATISARGAVKELPSLRARRGEAVARIAKEEQECNSLKAHVEAAQAEVASAHNAGSSRVESMRGRIADMEKEMEALRIKIDTPAECRGHAADDLALRDKLKERGNALVLEAKAERDLRDQAWHKKEALSTEVSAFRSRNKEYTMDLLKAREFREQRVEFESAQAFLASELRALDDKIKELKSDRSAEIATKAASDWLESRSFEEAAAQ